MIYALSTYSENRAIQKFLKSAPHCTIKCDSIVAWTRNKQAHSNIISLYPMQQGIYRLIILHTYKDLAPRHNADMQGQAPQPKA